jgi:putative radical SAM enzyme (TIGR03279 family)
MSLRVEEIIKGSIAENAGFCSGDEIVSINGKEIFDFIGLHFHSSEPFLEFVVKSRDGTQKKIDLEQDWQEKLGIVPAPYKIRQCSNNCVFCFIDQMPKNLRKSLYVKDDDYLFSFVYGNYISLNNLGDNDFRRIIEERISPLYISVHTTNQDLRKKIMRYRREFDIVEKLRYLSDNRIAFHTQIVILPGLNDTEELRNTILDLAGPKLNTLSIGLVPVGLTKYRKNLYPLDSVTTEQAKEIIETSRELKDKTGFNQIYCADELFILAGMDIPEIGYYDDFCQLENGIGMIRATIENWEKKKQKLIKKLPKGKILFVTGMLAEKYLRVIARDINCSLGTIKAEVLGVKNDFWGHEVTVTGLLTFRDISDQLTIMENLPDTIVFSSNMFNVEGYTIDGIHQNELKIRLNRNVMIINELWNQIDKQEYR